MVPVVKNKGGPDMGPPSKGFTGRFPEVIGLRN
jgi:hypothetical protein